ncbi:MAG: Fe-S oxidoreductase [Candidatus Omnitrophica bacterium]|nr:Fe-S oxidoreductase [Candidatus Omnitrophota bacterium]
MKEKSKNAQSLRPENAEISKNRIKGDILKQYILLVEPKFPTRTKSKNHKNFLPIGLLKLAAWYKRKKKCKVELARGKTLPKTFKTPSRIEITSLFTYWSEYVWDAVKFYRENFPDPDVTEIRLGGIYASLHYENKEFQDRCKRYNVNPIKGVQEEAERFFPYYELLNNGNSIDYQIVHTSRGCHRNCSFCGTWILEPEFKGRKKIWAKIKPGLKLGLKNLVFYDNNLFYNPHIRDILNELIELKKQRKIGWSESQSGFDGRILTENPDLAILLKKAGFRYPRIAWDWDYDQWPKVEKQIQILRDAGYNSKDIYVFMIYNWDLNFEEMEEKRIKCREWNVQISDCRNRPLNRLHDYYKPLCDQGNGEDYYIHPDWTDAEVKQFRKNVRRQNICVRQNYQYHSKLLEHKKYYSKEEYVAIKSMSIEEAKKYLPDLWIPSNITRPINRNKWSVEKVKKPHEAIPVILTLPPIQI